MSLDDELLALLRCPACGWTHWNNPTPVLAAVDGVDGVFIGPADLHASMGHADRGLLCRSKCRLIANYVGNSQ